VVYEVLWRRLKGGHPKGNGEGKLRKMGWKMGWNTVFPSMLFGIMFKMGWKTQFFHVFP
jgi:hypothetical protein